MGDGIMAVMNDSDEDESKGVGDAGSEDGLPGEDI